LSKLFALGSRNEKENQNIPIFFHTIPGEGTPLSTWKPCATELYLHFLNYITKMGQNFIKFF
jgi:hypothetical protein